MYFTFYYTTNDAQLLARIYKIYTGKEKNHVPKRQVNHGTRSIYATDAGTVSEGMSKNYN